jgi:hypothetical protein
MENLWTLIKLVLSFGNLKTWVEVKSCIWKFGWFEVKIQGGWSWACGIHRS